MSGRNFNFGLGKLSLKPDKTGEKKNISYEEYIKIRESSMYFPREILEDQKRKYSSNRQKSQFYHRKY